MTTEAATIESAPPEPASAAPPGALAHFVVRLALVYFALYLLPYPIDNIPYLWTLAGYYHLAKSWLVTWVGASVLGLPVQQNFTGSGDTSYDYVAVLTVALAALLVSALWAAADRAGRSYERLAPWLRAYVRICLGLIILGYGAAKIFQSQFPAPTLDRLVQPYGESSPMGLLWAMMGASYGYSLFGGLCEAVGGLLLVARRTALLGALATAGVLLNVVMLNFCYDVPVKLYSSHLLAMALLLVAPDARRLYDFFIRHRPAVPTARVDLVRHRFGHRGLLVARALLFGYMFYATLQVTYQRQQIFREASTRTPLYGIWTIDDPASAPRVDGRPWIQAIFSRPELLVAVLEPNSHRRLLLQIDTEARTMVLTRRDLPGFEARLTYSQETPEKLRLQGHFGGRKLDASFHRVEPPEFVLTTRGFHWVNEYPYSR